MRNRKNINWLFLLDYKLDHFKLKVFAMDPKASNLDEIIIICPSFI